MSILNHNTVFIRIQLTLMYMNNTIYQVTMIIPYETHYKGTLVVVMNTVEYKNVKCMMYPPTLPINSVPG